MKGLQGSTARWLIVLTVFLALIAAATVALFRAGEDEPVRIKGIVWQTDNATVDIKGRWHRLGAEELVIQWSVVDDIAFMPGTGLRPAPRLPDWNRIAREPWAKSVILGLAGRFDERAARAARAELAALSARIAALPTPLNVSGWYFPVEVDPTWQDAPALAALLEDLPRPLWISVYDSANVGAETLTDWLAGWLPDDVGILFQDGVGVHARDASVAREYADALAGKLGANRVRIIVEAFRPNGTGGFRPASAEELAGQLEAMRGYEIYLFDGPHYVHDSLVNELLEMETPAETQ